MRCKTWVSIIFMLSLGLLSGCGTVKPKSFSTKQSPTWIILEIREGLAYTRAWDEVVELLVKNFDIDVAIREEGYVRTAWMHTLSGEYKPDYRVRVTVKFSPGRDMLQFRAEAQLFDNGTWIMGYDHSLIATLKGDLMGIVSRSVR